MDANSFQQKPFLIIDGDLVTYVSPDYLKLLHYPGNEPPPAFFSDIKTRIHPEDIALFETKVNAAIKNKENETTLCFREKLPDGNYLFINGIAKFYFKNDNQPARIYLIYSGATTEPRQPAKEKTIPLVLIVEDNKMNMYLHRELINGILPGCKIIEAWDGNQGVGLFKQWMPDLVLMDINLPYKNGYQAALQIREYEQTTGTHCPILALTAKQYQGEKERCIAAGMDDYLPKPVNKDQLENRVLTLLGKLKPQEGKLQNHIDAGADTNNISSVNTIRNDIYDSPFSYTRIEKMSNGNNAFIKQFLTIYIEDTKELCDSLDIATQLGDYVKIKSISHKLKGAIDLLEIKTISTDIRNLESQSEEKKDLSSLRKIAERIILTIEFVMGLIKEDLSRIEDNPFP